MAAKKGSSRIAATARSSCARASRRRTSLQASGLGTGAMAAHPPRPRRRQRQRRRGRLQGRARGGRRGRIVGVSTAASSLQATRLAHCGRRGRIVGAGAAPLGGRIPGGICRCHRSRYGHRACLPGMQGRIIPCPCAGPAQPPAAPAGLPPRARTPAAAATAAAAPSHARVCGVRPAYARPLRISPPRDATGRSRTGLAGPSLRVYSRHGHRQCISPRRPQHAAVPVTLTSRGRRPSILPAGTACRKRTGVSSFGF